MLGIERKKFEIETLLLGIQKTSAHLHDWEMCVDEHGQDEDVTKALPSPLSIISKACSHQRVTLQAPHRQSLAAPAQERLPPKRSNRAPQVHLPPPERFLKPTKAFHCFSPAQQQQGPNKMRLLLSLILRRKVRWE